MFENKYNYETNTKETEYVPVAEVHEKRKSGKIIKAVAAVCCAAAVSFGSVTVYKDCKENSEKKKDAAAEKALPAYTESADVNSDTDYEVTNLLQLSKSEGSLTTQEVYQKVLPSVVGVTSIFTYRQQNQMGGFFGYGNQGGSQTGEVKGTGTGIVMSADGYIITNAHVIYDSEYGGKASSVTVLLSNKEEYEADVVGYDTQTDIAVLKVKDAPALTPAEFGDSSALSVGDTALAIGNPLGFDLFGTLTVGYISGLNREIAMDDAVMHLIQTDAAINSGNSGGPLVNDKGQVIGINSMKMSSSYGSSNSATIEGLGFAIPINEAQKIVDDLLNNGYVTGRPQLGISAQDVTSGRNSSLAGIYIVGVNENGAAEKAGLQAGDVIVGANDKQVSTISELNQIKNQFKAGDTLKLTVIRDNRYVEINVVLEETAVMTEDDASAEPAAETQQPEEAQEQQMPEDDTQQGEVPYGGQGGYGFGGGFPFSFPDFGFDFPF